MYKKYICLVFIVLLGVVGNTLADANWDNGSGDRRWDNATNWDPNVLPTASDKAAIRASIPGPIIDSGTAAEAKQVVLSDWSSSGDTLDITGGTLTTGSWFIIGYGAGNDGTFNVSGGNTTCKQNLHVGFTGTGHMNMTAGTVTVPNNTFGIATNGGSGHVQLDGGTISCKAFSMQTGATMDIGGGTLIINGNAASTINTYISNGWLTAYDGSGTLDVDYDNTNPGKTTATAFLPSEPPTKATDPIPMNNATDLLITPTLSWAPGLDASSHDVYFGTNSPPTFRGNQTAAKFKPGILDPNNVYYWRIDEKNVLGTTTGDIWSFTTTDDITHSQTLTGKVMCGYQGWFNCSGDGASRGWVHWGRSNRFEPGYCTVDWWPDMSEYDADEKFATGFEYPDTSTAHVFSSFNNKTVLRHFSWMAEYGIDGVFLQRFATETTPGSTARNHRDQVMLNCQEGGNLYNRAWAMMYDLSGLGSGSDIQKVVNDWEYLVDTFGISQDPTDLAYLHHNGKPVVTIWGLGFGRSYEGQDTYNLIDFLKNDPTYGGCTVMLGVDDDWRSNSDSWFQQTALLADIISPWAVGRYGSTNHGGLDNFTNNVTVPDKAWCDTNGKDYLPVVFPGFSWQNLKDEKWDHIPRLGGSFLWRQYYKAIVEGGVTMVYQAMFDEVDEGTAIFKCTSAPPIAEEPYVFPSTPFLPTGNAQFAPYDPCDALLRSDEYLWLVGQATRGLRGEIPVNETRPVRQLSDPASNPSPADSATVVAVNADLSWTAGNYADSHDVYFGTNPTPGTGEFQGNQTSTSFDPGTLAYETYYWRIDEKNTSGKTKGPVWSFTTKVAPADLNNDGRVNLQDMAILGSAWQTSSGYDFDDLLLIAHYWLMFVEPWPRTIDIELTLDNVWMYQNLPNCTNSNLTADTSIIDDPLANSSYTYDWDFVLPNDVTISPTIIDGGTGNVFCTFAAPSCNELSGLSDSGRPLTVRVTVTGDNFSNTGSTEAQFGMALLGDVNNDSAVDETDRSFINDFWRTGSAQAFSLRDCDMNSDGFVNVADRAIANAVWRGVLGQNSASQPCPLR